MRRCGAAVRAAAGGDLRRLQAMRPRDLSREPPLSRWEAAPRDAFLEAARDLRSGELGTRARGLGALRGREPSTPWRTPRTECACAARLTANTTDAAAAALNRVPLLEVRRWVPRLGPGQRDGRPPEPPTVERRGCGPRGDGRDVHRGKARRCDAQHAADRGPPRLAEHDDLPARDRNDDDLLNVARTVELRLENELGVQRARRARPPSGWLFRRCLRCLPRHRGRPERRSRRRRPRPSQPRRRARRREAASGEARSAAAENNGTFAEAVLASVTCPISQSLVVRPVIAEDGKRYERAHIERWLRARNASSPLTNQRMGTRLADHGDGRT